MTVTNCLSAVVMGTCGLCGGRVLRTASTIASCESCGALAAQHGPVIPMVRRQLAPVPAYVPYVPSTTPAWPYGWDVICGASTSGAPVTIPNTMLATADENWLDLCQRTIADLKASAPPSA